MRLNITLDGKTYEVEVEVAEPEPPAARFFTPPGSNNAFATLRQTAPSAPTPEAQKPVDESKVCRSPLAGVVTEINVEVGQQVEVNQPLLVLEAMKMFTTITSPVAGKVKAIHVDVRDAVKQGQLLVEIE